MMTLLHQARRAKRLLLALTVIPVVIIAGITALPKDETNAADSRLTMVGIVFAALFALTVGGTLALRRFRDSSLRLRYAKASRAMKDTVGFLLEEKKQGRRGRLLLTGGLVVTAAFAVLSHWPQGSSLRPYQDGLIGSTLLTALLLAIQPYYARRQIINAAFLTLYLRQQAAHIGFKPGCSVQRRNSDEPPVVITKPMSFRVAGFDWEFSDLQKNVLVLGQPGSGKTVCVLNAFLEALIACGPTDQRTAGLIIDYKGTWRKHIEGLFKFLGRADDLVIFDPDTWNEFARTQKSVAINPVDTDEEGLEVASRLVTPLKLGGGMKTSDSFFPDSARTFMRHGFELPRAAFFPEPANLRDIHRLCGESTEAPVFYNELVERLVAKYPDTVPSKIENAIEYFSTEYHVMPARQLAGVRSTVKQILDDFTTEPIAEMVSGRTTIRIADMIDQGKVLYVHLPISERERIARILTTLIRLEFQREILRRPKKSRPTFMVVDEFQSMFLVGENAGDSDFLERSRESNHANVIACQNISSLLKKTSNRSDVLNLLGLCASKIFLRNSERETNEWASNLFGERSEIIVSASEAARLDGGFKRNQTSYNRSTQSRRVVPPEAFVELAVPVEGDPTQQFAESIVQLGSRAAIQKLELSWPIHPFPKS